VEAALARHMKRPLRVFVPLFAVSLAVPILVPGAVGVARALAIVLVAAGAWAILAFFRAIEDVLLERFRIDVADNLEARKVHTQFELVRKILAVVVTVVAAALILMSFEAFRSVGTGLLASAGIAGLVLGLAAQKTLGNLVAGFQIAMTQPIRLDDVVVVEGEWGRIEEITLTYVVVRIWDLRRLVLPISYFIETPFQNWTRTSAEVLGTVFLHVDYMVPVEAVRSELRRILEASPHWDRNVCVVHVTGAGERTVEVGD
jgi:small-conductance mechanosensitive channel